MNLNCPLPSALCPLLVVTYEWVPPLGIVVAGVAAALAAWWLASLILGWLAPRVAGIARVTAKESYSQPLFWVELALGMALLMLFAIVPFNTFGDDVKVMKESGLTLIVVLATIQAVWSASVSIADELEGRTALTLLSKPITRRQFVLGKFLGVITPVFMMFVVLGVVFLTAVSFKVSFDTRDTLHIAATADQCQRELLQAAPGLLLGLFEVIMLAAVSVAISTRLGMVPNLVLCAAIYALGHLVPLLVQSPAARNLPLVAFVGQLLSTILPVLDHFTIQAAVASGRDVPLDYLIWAAGYCALYSTVALLLALILFEDRDLA